MLAYCCPVGTSIANNKCLQPKHAEIMMIYWTASAVMKLKKIQVVLETNSRNVLKKGKNKGKILKY